MTVRPARLPRALVVAGVALLLPLSACAGTDEPADAATSSSSSSSSPATSSSAPGSSAAQSEAPAAQPTPPAAGSRIEVQVTGGQATGDTGRVPVRLGEQVTLAITSDTPDEVHVHGYDLTADLVPGTPAELTFEASIPGVFEVELHDAGTALLALQVS